MHTASRPSLRELFYFASRRDILVISFAAGLFLLVGGIQSALNLIMAEVLNVGPGQSLEDAGTNAIIYLGGYLGGSLFAVFAFGSLAALYTRYKMMQQWRVRYVQAILRQDAGWYDVNQAQELAGRMGEAMVLIDKAFSVPTYLGCMPVGMVVGAAAISLFVAPALAAIPLSLALVLVVPASVVLSRTVSTRTRLLADAYSEAGGFCAEVLGAARTVASLGLEDFAVQKYDEVLANAEAVAVRTAAKLALSTATITAFVFYACGAASMFALSTVNAQMRRTSFDFEADGESFCVPDQCNSFDPFIFAASLGLDYDQAVREDVPCNSSGWRPFRASCASGEGIDGLFGSISTFPANLTEVAFDEAGEEWPCGGVDFEMILVGINSIVFGFLQLPMAPAALSAVLRGMTAAHSCLLVISREPPFDPFSDDGDRPESVKGGVEVRDVRFAYPAAPSFFVCRGYSLQIAAGTSCALVGPSGSGKSTIVALLQRFYDPQAGAVLLDGRDIRTLNLRWLRSQLGLVGQEPILFQGSVAENIRYGKQWASQEEVEEAARQANAHGFITADLSEGYDTQVGQSGSKLSGGQKQRVAIARAIVRKPAIMLLDEATSALDNKSEKVVQAALDHVMQALHTTSVVIAHRLSTIRGADKIAVICKGAVVEQGTYDELLAIGEGGLFHGLAAKQEKDSGEDRLVEASLSTSRRPARPTRTKALDAAGEAGAAQTHTTATDAQPSAEDEALEAKERPASAVKRLISLYSRRNKMRLAFGFVASALCGCAAGFMGAVLTHATFPFRDEYDPDALESIVVFWGVLAISLGAFIHIFETLYKTQFAVSGEALTRRLRVLTLQKLLRQDMGYFDEDSNSVGALTAFLASRVSLVQGVVQDNLQGLIVLIATLFTAVGVSVSDLGEWRVLLIFIGGYLPFIVFLVVGQVITGSQEERHKAQGADGDESEGSRTAGALVGEVVGAIKTVASFNAEERVLERYSAAVAEERRRVTGWRMYVGSMCMAIGQAGAVAIFGVVLYYAFWVIENNAESLFTGNDSCPIPSIDIGRMFVPMFSIVGFLLAIGSNAAVAIDAKAGKDAATQLFARIERVSLRDPSSPDGERLDEVRGAIEVRDVRFAYPTRPDLWVCRGYSLQIAAGTSCALVGPSGSGKSTIVALLQRFYDPQAGAVLLDGRDIRTLNLRWLRSQLGLVGQEPILFQGSVAENIRYGKQGASQEEVEEAARQANAHGFITADLSEGYNTQVGLRGGHLSGGQKQRVAIARAIVRKPAIMLLDEATSALDNESEKVVQAALDALTARSAEGLRQTTITIAHRLSTIRGADKIAVMSKGVVKEQGTHDELLVEQGMYAELLALGRGSLSTVPVLSE